METEVHCSAIPSREPAVGSIIELCFLRFIGIFLSKPCSLIPTLSSEFLNVEVILKPDNSSPVQVSSTEQSLLKITPAHPPPITTGLNETLKTAVKVSPEAFSTQSYFLDAFLSHVSDLHWCLKLSCLPLFSAL